MCASQSEWKFNFHDEIKIKIRTKGGNHKQNGTTVPIALQAKQIKQKIEEKKIPYK